MFNRINRSNYSGEDMKIFALVDTSELNEYESVMLFVNRKDAEIQNEYNGNNKNMFEIREIELTE